MQATGLAGLTFFVNFRGFILFFMQARAGLVQVAGVLRFVFLVFPVVLASAAWIVVARC